MPLAHILAPQIAKKTAEIEAALAPASVGYLQTMRPPGEAPIVAPSQARGRGYLGPPTPAPAPVEPAKGPAPASGMTLGPRGRNTAAQRKNIEALPDADPATPAPTAPVFRIADAAPPTAAEAGLKALRDAPPNSPWQVFKNAALLAAAEEARRQKGTQLLPNAPVPAPVEAAPRKGGVIPLPKGAVGVTEDGQAVDKKGKKLGYLSQPAMVTPYGDVPMRTSDRRPNDILVTKDEGLLDDDALGTYHLQQMYGKHLNETRENRGPDGLPTDKFPEGYFKGMTKKERENIMHGVKALRALEQGTRT